MYFVIALQILISFQRELKVAENKLMLLMTLHRLNLSMKTISSLKKFFVTSNFNKHRRG